MDETANEITDDDDGDILDRFYEACDVGDIETVERLISTGLSLEMLKDDSAGYLYHVVTYGYVELLKRLHAHGFLSVEDIRASDYFLFIEACTQQQLGVVEYFMSLGLDAEDIMNIVHDRY